MANNTEIKAFIKTFGTIAVQECNRRIAMGEGFPLPSVCMAQSALESDWGTAGLMTKANAFFGIKAGGSWTGKIYVADTWEVAENGERYNTVANFRAYDSLEDSMRDYYDLIVYASRYKDSLSYGTDRTKWKTARECITAIWQGGYATDNLYVQKIMNTIEGRNLTEWDSKVDGTGEIVGSMTGTASFGLADMVSGKITAGDSGRALFNDNTDKRSFALNVEKAFTATKNDTIQISTNYFAKDYTLYVVGQVGDVVTQKIATDQDTSFNVVAGEKIAFYLTSKYQTDINFLPNYFDDFTITLKGSNDYPENEEIIKSAIAYFIKIE